MRYAQLAKKLYQEPWFIEPSIWFALHYALQARMAGQVVDPEEFSGGLAWQQSAGRRDLAGLRAGGEVEEESRGRDVQAGLLRTDRKREGEYSIVNGIAVIPLHGIIGKRLSWWDVNCLGGYDVDFLIAELEKADQDEDVSKIVIDGDTPGGSGLGLRETARFIRDRVSKEVIAYTEAGMYSAGMWLAFACDRIIAAETAGVGSIGSYIVIDDYTGLFREAGVERHVFKHKQSDLKAMGMPGKELTDAEKKFIQDRVDKHAEEFFSFAKASRERNGFEIGKDAMRGQPILGLDALEMGLIDGVCDSLMDCLEGLATEAA